MTRNLSAGLVGRRPESSDFPEVTTDISSVNVGWEQMPFICGGAFAGLEHTINIRLSASSIGFGATVRHKSALESQKAWGTRTTTSSRRTWSHTWVKADAPP